MSEWQAAVGRFYNFCLADRIHSHKQTMIEGAYCEITNQPKSYVLNSEDDFAAHPITCSVSKSASVGYPWKSAEPALRRAKDKTKPQNPQRSAYEMHSSLIAEWRRTKPEYKSLSADVLQQSLRHLDKAFSNFFARSFGYPRFKKYCQVGFEFKPGTVRVNGNYITFPVLGTMQFFKSREIPKSWELRTATVKREADGWYASILLRDETIPVTSRLSETALREGSHPRAGVSPHPQRGPHAPPVEGSGVFPRAGSANPKGDSEIKLVLGVDVGLKKIASLSDGTTVPNRRFLKKLQRRLAICQCRLSRRKKGSRNRAQAGKQVARVHQKIRRQREDFQWKLAKKLSESADVIAFENLNIKGMKARCKPKKDELTGKYLSNNQRAKSQLNKAIVDASWYSLKLKTEYQASKLGRRVVTVNPRYSSQECSECHYISPLNRAGEKFVCEQCSHHADADVDGAVIIAQRAAQSLGNKVLVVSQKLTLKPELTGSGFGEISLPLGGEPGNPLKVKYVQMSLFDLEEWETG